VDFECRTTYDGSLIADEDLLKVAECLLKAGVQKWVWQRCLIRSEPDDIKLPFPSAEMLTKVRQLVNVELRE
jgi:hypothetical protein